MKSHLFVVATAFTISACGAASPFTAGDYLVSSTNSGDLVSEYTPQGVLVQAITVPLLSGQNSAWDYNRGMAVDGKGRLVVYSGTFDAGISIFDPLTNNWTSALIPGLSVTNDASMGKVVVDGKYAFLTDQFTYGAEANGIVRYDMDTGEWTRFAETSTFMTEPIDLKIGPDGLLYSLEGSGSPSGTSLSIYDPNSLQLVRTIDLSSLAWGNQQGGIIRQLAIRSDGDIWLNQLYSPTFLIDPQGNLLGTYNCQNTSYIDDFAMDSTGGLVQADFDGHVYVYDKNMNLVRDFQTSNYYFSQSFLAIVPQSVPEPGGAIAIAAGFGFIVRRKRAG